MRERAYVASGGARRADERAELHRRGVDDRGIRIVVGQDRRHRSEVALARRAGLRASADARARTRRVLVSTTGCRSP
jgi:hypothetical protein